MRSMSLAGADWSLACHWPNQWHMRNDAPWLARPMLPPIPATVPGGVHADLLRAGLIPDWQNNIDAFASEWVEHRQWNYTRTVTLPAEFDRRLTLECEGLDYAGHILIDDELAGSFEGTHLRHRFDLTGRVRPGRAFRLDIIFEPPPEVDGQIGWTSRTRIFKPRFGYEWDWCNRVVNVGIWQDLRIVSRGASSLEKIRVLPRLSGDLQSGTVLIAGEVAGERCRMRCVLTDGEGRAVHDSERPVEPGVLDETLAVGPVALWWPCTHGEQPLYHLRVTLLDEGGNESDVIERTIGFKQVTWRGNPGAPEGARPYLCEVNGQRVFLRGVNWVPLSPVYGAVARGQYEWMLQIYRNMNANVLRVWGGAILETETFYELCDQLGLLVWQEFPLSSSGIENWPPEDPEVIERLQGIGREYIERRCHHASHLLWCGGNELQGSLDGSKTAGGKPIDETHPLMQRWSRLVAELDPGKRFLATSPMGPRFTARPGDYGKGLHHHIHGPWANLPLSERNAYWNGDDSLFRSECGAPGCARPAALERHRGRGRLWPPDASNPVWLSPSSWWIPWDDVSREFGSIPNDPGQLQAVVAASRYLQAESYRYAAESVRRHFPHCGGFIIWMGHDCVHCPSNNSVVEIDGATKPAYDWLQQAWARRHVSLELAAIGYPAGAPLTGKVWVHQDSEGFASGHVTARLLGLDGRVHASAQGDVSGVGESVAALALAWDVPAFEEALFCIEVAWEEGGILVRNRYLLSQEVRHPLAALQRLAPAVLNISPGRDGVTVQNDGRIAAVGVRIVAERPAEAMADAGNLLLLPGESVAIRVEGPARAPGTLSVEWMNRAESRK